MNVTALLSARIVLTLQGTAVGELTPSSYLDETHSRDIDNGTGAEQADKAYSFSGTLTAGGTVGLDLVGSIADVFGQTFSVAKLKGMLLVNTSTVGSGGNIRIKNATTIPDGAGSSQHFNLGPQGISLLYDPNAAGLCSLTAGTADLLVLENTHTASSATYTLHIVGTSV